MCSLKKMMLVPLVIGAFALCQGAAFAQGPLTNGENHSGSIAVAGEADTWTFTADQNDAIALSVGELVGSAEPGFVPRIELRDPTNVLLEFGSGSLVGHINLAAAPVSGTYSVRVLDSGNASTGSYQLTLAKTPGVFLVPSGDEGGPLTNGLDHPGAIHLGDLDLWTFTASEDEAISVSIAEVPAGGALVPWIRLFDPSGVSLGSQFGATLAEINAVAPVSGTYTVLVTTADAGRDATGSYQLTAVITGGAGGAPITVNDAFSTAIDTPLAVPAPGVLANDNSNGGATMSAVLIASVSNGGLALNDDGSFTYTPSPGFSGTDSFTYRATNAGGTGNEATASITVSNETAQPPTGLVVSSIVGNVVTLRWNAPLGGLTPTGYVLEAGINPGEVLASIATGSTSPIFAITAPTGAFYVRMHTISGGSRSGASNEIRVFVNVPAPPSAPANLLGMVNGSSVGLAWQNTFEGGAPTSVVLDLTGSIVASIPLGLTDTFSFANVPPGTYTASLRAVNASGASAASNAVTLTFPGACSGAPLIPTNFLAYTSGSTIIVIWDPAESGPAPTGFVLNVTGGFVGSFGTAGRTLSGLVGPGTYSLSVVATNACGASAPTAVQTVVIP